MIETRQEIAILDIYRSKVDVSTSTAAIGKHGLPYPTHKRQGFRKADVQREANLPARLHRASSVVGAGLAPLMATAN